MREQLEAHMEAEELVPLALALGAVVSDVFEARTPAQAAGDALDQLVSFGQSKIHAVRPEGARDVRGVAGEPDSSVAETAHQSSLEVHHRAPIHALHSVAEPGCALAQ